MTKKAKFSIPKETIQSLSLSEIDPYVKDTIQGHLNNLAIEYTDEAILTHAGYNPATNSDDYYITIKPKYPMKYIDITLNIDKMRNVTIPTYTNLSGQLAWQFPSE